MPTSYTSLLGLALPQQGELANTWGDTVNTAVTALIESSIAGTTTLTTDADVTLTTTTGAANQARSAVILLTGARTSVRNVTAPASSKTYVVGNLTTGGFDVVFRGAGPTAGVTIPAGKVVCLAWNGTDFVGVGVVASSLSGTVPIANGGTGATTAGAALAALGAAPTASPTFTGIPAAPTAAPGTNTTQLATTAFVAATAFASTLPAQTGNAGKTLTTDGTTASWVEPGLTVVVVSGTTQTAVKNAHYILTNVAASTVTLPASPASGDTVWVTWTNSLATNVIARNGQTIMGLAEDMTLDASTNGTVQLRFVNSSWRIL